MRTAQCIPHGELLHLQCTLYTVQCTVDTIHHAVGDEYLILQLN